MEYPTFGVKSLLEIEGQCAQLRIEKQFGIVALLRLREKPFQQGSTNAPVAPRFEHRHATDLA